MSNMEEVIEKSRIIEMKGIITGYYVPSYPDGKYAGNFSHGQFLLLGQIKSAEDFPDGDFRYRMLSLQESYDLFRSETENGKNFKKLYKNHEFHNREIVTRQEKIIRKAHRFIEEKVIPDPLIIETGGKPLYIGNSINVTIEEGLHYGEEYNDIFDVLEKTGSFRGIKPKSELTLPLFFEKGVSSVRSLCYIGTGFHAFSDRPSYRNPLCLAAFAKIHAKKNHQDRVRQAILDNF